MSRFNELSNSINRGFNLKSIIQIILKMKPQDDVENHPLYNFIESLKNYSIELRTLTNVFHEMNGKIRSSDTLNRDERIHHVTTSNAWLSSSLGVQR